VLTSRIRTGVRAGLISAAATAGAVIGFGIRHGDWSGPFVSLGTQVMRGFGVTDVTQFIPLAAGVAAHVGWMVLWGIAFAAMANKRTLAITVSMALLVGAGAALIARFLIPAAMGAVWFAGLPGTQAVLCVALMTAGLVTGRVLATTN
jgi:hypothetical protein